MFKHKYRIGDKVVALGKLGEIFTLGHAAVKGRNFTVCKEGTETDNADLIGYQVIIGRKIQIVKETDIVSA
jgi:hypothetical protein